MQTDSLGNGIYCLDSNYYREEFTAAYLITDGEEAALVDVGSNASVPFLLEAIASLGIALEQFRYLILTHVHLDHCGGAGALIQYFPNATVLVQESGIEHLVNPSRLLQGTVMVYGKAFVDEYYGEVKSIDAERIQQVGQGDRLPIGNRYLDVLYTPGHAWHHNSFYDQKSGIVFAGDAMGVSYNNVPHGYRLWFPATPPSQFNPQVMQASVDAQADVGARYFALAHYNVMEYTVQGVSAFKAKIDQYAQLAEDAPENIDQLDVYVHDAVQALFKDWLAKELAGNILDRAIQYYAPDIFLSAKGISHWVRRQRQKDV